MDSEELHLASFCDWPPTAGVQPEPLAAAGFFHTGVSSCYSPKEETLCRVSKLVPPAGSWGQWEEPEDTAPATPSDVRGSQEWLEWRQSPGVSSPSHSQLVANLLQDEDHVARARAPVHGGPELLESRREIQSEESSETGTRDAQEQLQRLQEARTCKVCLDRAISVVFVPCGHLVCTQCAPNLQLCPICRAPIHSCVRTFLS